MCWEPTNLTRAHRTLLPRIHTRIETFLPSHSSIEKPVLRVLAFLDVWPSATSTISFMTSGPPSQASWQTSYPIIILGQTLNLIMDGQYLHREKSRVSSVKKTRETRPAKETSTHLPNPSLSQFTHINSSRSRHVNKILCVISFIHSFGAVEELHAFELIHPVVLLSLESYITDLSPFTKH